MQPLLNTAANEHQVVSFEDQDSVAWLAATNHLEQELGFQRSGQPVIGAGERIHQSFSRGHVEILSGWDTWSGDYLLATCPAGDDALRNVFAFVIKGTS